MIDLDKEFYSEALGETTTLRGYLKALLLTLWKEQDGFSGKRPFGNSGWDYELQSDLARAEVIEGKEIDEYSWEANGDFNQMMIDTIKAL